ncbi:unnamed protein product [Schistosoma curassoni]|uniref:Ovule protein n=1 Tax=Schistosoma curassoni TaxID=6186 RepID=A0A183L457_9TREM|nr:unnamed protein product [Schistosoma curassoni]
MVISTTAKKGQDASETQKHSLLKRGGAVDAISPEITWYPYFCNLIMKIRISHLCSKSAHLSPFYASHLEES